MPPLCENPDLKGVLPPDFVQGYASASYQIEGGHDTDGRLPSVWDITLRAQGLETGDEAVDSYHLWREDVRLLKEYGCNAYRFSVSWSRVRPLGGKDDPVNEKGIGYYNNLIDALLEANITPYITLFHWDLPQPLQDRYKGFRAANKAAIIEDFVSYAELLFERFGDRVKNWITLNEPFVYVILDAVVLNSECDFDNDPFTVAHNQILVHAHTVDLYRRKFQPTQGGRIGITLNIDWVVPIDESQEAKDAADLAVAMALGWVGGERVKGELSSILKKRYPQLPDFTPDEWKIVKGSSDFFGLNHYGTKWATGKIVERGQVSGFQFFGAGVEQVAEKDGVPIGRRGHNGHPYTVPWGFRQLLNHVHKQYAGPNGLGIIITENGFAIQDEADRTLEQIVDDKERQEYYDLYITELCQAHKEGIKMEGYLGWSLLDNLEWNQGYAPRFGVTHVDRANGFKRTPKDSTKVLKAIWQHTIKSDK
ncbi:hypothetical protein FFLO_06625 [Filobasidium floriforme]|uniref:Beta-glucosidase n=1 Tax=Filobasidium floriforme TaxID=5210 RepID=A0A8K0JF06_9TREE|nr:hypothetical protein FFLO_06625 [Filobasidium floriforme]